MKHTHYSKCKADEEKSIRQIAREIVYDRKTIRKYSKITDFSLSAKAKNKRKNITVLGASIIRLT